MPTNITFKFIYFKIDSSIQSHVFSEGITPNRC